jgi:hypothetical protein
MKKTPFLQHIVRGFATGVGLFWLAGACGGQTTPPAIVGSESHFLMRCTDTCDSELSCIAGLCTRSCIAGVDSCTDLASTAVCTNQSVEPGAVAVCDVSCSEREDCAALGDEHVCDAGFCRLEVPSETPPSQLVCEDYLDQVPPNESPGVTIVNTGARTLYVQYVAPRCPRYPSLIGVQRVTADGSRSDVDIYGSACAPSCNDTAENGWQFSGEGDLEELAACPGTTCAGRASVPIEPGASLFEPGRLEVVAGRLPRDCASGIRSDAVNCYRRVIPADTGNYVVTVAASVTPDCGPGCELLRFSTAPTRWFFEAQTLEVAAP